MVPRPPGAQPQRGALGSRRARRACADGAHRGGGRAGSLAARSSASASAAPSVSPTSRTRGARRWISTRSSNAILGDLGDRTCDSFRVSARRADKRFPMTSPQIEREVGGRIKEARGWRVNLDEPALTIHVELLTDQAFYLLRQGTRAGRAADRDCRPRRVPAVRRYRFACRRASHDEARVRRHLRALSQLSDPVARVAGEGPRAGAAADDAGSTGRGCISSRSARSSSRSCSSVPGPMRVVFIGG